MKFFLPITVGSKGRDVPPCSRDPPGHHHTHRQASLVPTFGACAGSGLVVLQGVADGVTHVCKDQHSGVIQMLTTWMPLK